MFWKGRRKGAVNSQERAESEAGTLPPVHSRAPLDMFAFLLNTRAGSRVSRSPPMVMNHGFV